jgi:internalin A
MKSVFYGTRILAYKNKIMFKSLIIGMLILITFSCVSIDTKNNIIYFPDKNLENEIKANEHILGNVLYRENLEKIVDLNLENKGIENLQGIENCINLKKLIIKDNMIKSIQPIMNLKNLDILDLTGNPIESIEPIKNLINLKSLTFGQHQTGENIKAKITTLEPLRRLTNLEELRLGHLKLDKIDLSPLAQLKLLKELNLQGTGISNIDVLKDLTNLEILWLHWGAYPMQISDISPLKRLTKLKVLDLDGDTVSDFSPIMDMTRLNEISLWGNPIQDLSVFTKLLANGAFQDKDFWSGPMIKIDLSQIDLSLGSENKKNLDILLAAGINIRNVP